MTSSVRAARWQRSRREVAGDHPELLQAHQQGRSAIHAGRVRCSGLSVRPQPDPALLRHRRQRQRSISLARQRLQPQRRASNPSRPGHRWKNILPGRSDLSARPPRKIDTKLSIPLSTLPGRLSLRRTRRKTWRSQHAAQARRSAVGTAGREGDARTVLSNATLGLNNDPGWGGEAPLWYYILKEAELPPYNGERLGPVGGRIMAETLVGLLQRDPNSYLYLDPAWKPITHRVHNRQIRILRPAEIRRCSSTT